MQAEASLASGSRFANVRNQLSTLGNVHQCAADPPSGQGHRRRGNKQEVARSHAI